MQLPSGGFEIHEKFRYVGEKVFGRQHTVAYAVQELLKVAEKNGSIRIGHSKTARIAPTNQIIEAPKVTTANSRDSIKKKGLTETPKTSTIEQADLSLEDKENMKPVITLKKPESESLDIEVASVNAQAIFDEIDQKRKTDDR